LFSYISPEARIPASHPLRKIRELVREVLGELNRSLGTLYASEGRPSIPPEQLLSALLLQVFYGIRSTMTAYQTPAQSLSATPPAASDPTTPFSLPQ
jgi:transposase